MRPSRHHALVLGAMFAFSLMALFTRRAGAPFLTVAAWRAILVTLVFGVWAVAESPARFAALKPDRKTLELGAIYGLCLAVASSTFVGGYAFTTVANTIFLHNLAPLAAFPLAWWYFRERPATNAVTGAALAIVGVGMLSGVSLFHLGHFSHPRFVAGDSLALLSALGYGAVLVMTRATRKAGTPILPTLFVAWGVAAVVLVLLALLFGTLAISPAGLLWVLGLAVVCTNLPFWLLNLGMREVSAGMAAVMSMSEVLFATLLGWLVFGELLSPLGWLGGVLVVIGVLYALLARAGLAAGEGGGEEPEPLSDSARTWRLARLGVWLALLNAGAVLALVTGVEVGVLLVWIAGVGMLRCAQPHLAGLLGGLTPQIGRWGTAVAAAALLGALWLRGGWGDAGASVAGLLAAAMAVTVDVLLAAREPAEERDGAPSLRGALLLVVAAQALALLEHPGARSLPILAAVVVALGAWGLLIDAVAGRLPGAPSERAGTLGRMESAVARFLPAPRFVALVGVVFLLGGVRAVPPGSVAIVERLGTPLEDVRPAGLLVRLPPPLERPIIVDVTATRRIALVTADTPLLCGDHSMVATEALLHYRVSDPMAFTFHIEDPASALVQIGRAALVQDVGHQPQDAVLATGRAELEARVRTATQQVVDAVGLGVQVLDVHLSSVKVPAAVAASYLDVISADEEKRTLVNVAEAYAARVLPEAFGQATAIGFGAEGEALRAAAASEGAVLRMEASHEGAALDARSTRYRLYAEAVEAALGGRTLVLVPEGRRVWFGDAGALQPSVTATALPPAK
ncbi:MAG: EamA family transporter [Pseudomonadota bacterium]